MASSEREKDKEALVGHAMEASWQSCKYEIDVDKQHAATSEPSVTQAGEEHGVSKSAGLAAPTFWKAEALHPLASPVKKKEEETDETVVTNGPRASVAPFQFSANPTLEDIRSLQATFTAERGWEKYHQPQNLLLALVGEVGELAELFQWREAAPEGLPGWTGSEREALSDELSDVLIYLVALANKCHVDLPSAALRKMEKNCIKYPAKLVYGSSKKYTEYQQ